MRIGAGGCRSISKRAWKIRACASARPQFARSAKKPGASASLKKLSVFLQFFPRRRGRTQKGTGSEDFSTTTLAAKGAEFAFGQFQVGIDHDANQLREVDPWLPADNAARLARIAHQQVNFGRPQKTFVSLDVFAPVERYAFECKLEKLLHRMMFASGDNIIISLRLLHH